MGRLQRHCSHFPTPVGWLDHCGRSLPLCGKLGFRQQECRPDVLGELGFPLPLVDPRCERTPKQPGPLENPHPSADFRGVLYRRRSILVFAGICLCCRSLKNSWSCHKENSPPHQLSVSQGQGVKYSGVQGPFFYPLAVLSA